MVLDPGFRLQDLAFIVLLKRYITGIAKVYVYRTTLAFRSILHSVQLYEQATEELNPTQSPPIILYFPLLIPSFFLTTSELRIRTCLDHFKNMRVRVGVQYSFPSCVARFSWLCNVTQRVHVGIWYIPRAQKVPIYLL